MNAKILLFDIETSPVITYMWRMWDELKSMDMVTQDWHILCWAAKWLGEKEMFSSSLLDFNKHKQKRQENVDKKVVQKLWKLLDEADIVIAHNAIKFDVRKVNARFAVHGIKPPSPYRVVDTLREARKYFMFTSNKLNDLGKLLKLGTKIDTGGIQLWKDCMDGKKSAWIKMVEYCKGDVILLELIYERLLPYMKTHPNLGVYEDRGVCPRCSSSRLQRRGFNHTNVATYQRVRCLDCGAWSRESKNLKKGKVLR